jgi:uroporphyrinogen decarboxylase
MKRRLPASIDVSVSLKHVMDAVKKIKMELKGKVPLIGFSAAPWTLMYYMVGGSSKSGQENGVNWLRNHPEDSKVLLNLLTTVVIEYMSAQVDAGADLLQVFEAMGMFIPRDLFEEWALPCMSRIAAELKARHPEIPLLVFPRGASYSIESLQAVGYDVVTLDTPADRKISRLVLEEAFNNSPGQLKRAASVQGNFDVALLQQGSTVAKVEAAVEEMLNDFGPQNLIANLGEGLGGKEDTELVAAFIDSVHSISERQIKESLKNSRASSFGI